jgi:hypothetical protein
MFYVKRGLFIVGVCLFFSLMVACGSGSENFSYETQDTPESQKNGINLQSSDSTTQTNKTSPNQDGAVKNAEKQGRKITYKATVSLDINNYAKARTQLEKLVSKSQGYLVDSEERQNSDDERTGEFTYRVPQAQFQPFINSLKAISSHEPEISIEGNDVTEEMVDLDARLKAKKATEARLLALMSKATDPNALLEISGQLDTTQTEIEQIQGRIQYLNHRIDFSEVKVTLKQEFSAPDNASMVEKMKEAFIDSSLGVLDAGKNVLIFLVGSIPVLLVLAIIVTPIYLWIRKRRRAKKQSKQEQK